MQSANDHLLQPADRQHGLVSFAKRHGETWIGVLLFLYFLFGFIGNAPLGGSELRSTTGGTNVGRQVLLIGIFCGVIPILGLYRHRVVHVLRLNMLPVLTYAWLMLTSLWSLHPALTTHRVIAELLVLSLLLATVCVMRSWRIIIYPITAAAIIIILADMAAVVLRPGLAIGPLGAMGIHTNKNLAGVITLIAVIVCGGTFFAQRNGKVRAALLPVIALGFVFLILTKSKTSLGLALAIYAAFPAFYLVFKRWSAAPAVVPVVALSLAALIVLFVACADVSQSEFLEFVFGDATLTRRTELWAFLHANIDQRPYLGWGWGAFWDTGSVVNPIIAPPQSWVLPATEINTAHNGYIDIWLQSGLIGLSLVVLIILHTVWIYASLLRQRCWGEENEWLIATAFAVVIALALYNFLESLIFHPADCLSTMFILCVLAGKTCYQQVRQVAPVALPSVNSALAISARSTLSGCPSPKDAAPAQRLSLRRRRSAPHPRHGSGEISENPV